MRLVTCSARKTVQIVSHSFCVAAELLQLDTLA